MSAVVGAQGSERVFWQPRRWTFWFYLAMMTFGVVNTAASFRLFASVAPGAWWFAAACYTVEAGALIALVRWLDAFRARARMTPLLAAGFGWGVLAAVPVALIPEAHASSLLAKLLSGRAATAWYPSLAAPITEEWLKAVGVLGVILIGRQFIRRPMHGLLVGAMTGVGFEVVENVGYTVNAALADPSSDFHGAVSVTLLRMASGIHTHWLFTAVAGLGIGYAITRQVSVRRCLPVALGLFGVAVGLHFLWNSPVSGGPAVAATLVLARLIVPLAVFFVLYRWAMRQEWRWFAAIMPPDQPRVISDGEVAAMRTRRRRRKARKHLGRAGRRLMRRRQRAQVRLAAALDGGDHVEIAQRRSEIPSPRQ